MHTSWDEEFADRYEEWSAEMTADVAFYVALAREAGGPVAELAVGNGRVAIPVAQAIGRPVLGIDSSPAMLEQARARSWKLCILSNTDRDFIDASMGAIGVPFDRAIVAGEIGSYKPAHGHWRSFENEVGRLPDVHVAASLFHDVGPTAELGIPCFWVNRLGETADGYSPARELRTLNGLAEALDDLAA